MKPNLIIPGDYDSYPREIEVDGHHFEYKNCFEIGMGGPQCGSFYIDGEKVDTAGRYGTSFFSKKDKAFFGIPFFLSQEKVYVPIFYLRRFQLASISLVNKKFITFGPKEGVLLVQEVLDGKVIYSKDGDPKIGLTSVKIPDICLR